MHGRGSVVQQFDRLLAVVADLGPGSDDVLFWEGFIAQLHFKSCNRVPEYDFSELGDTTKVLHALMPNIVEFGIVVSIRVAHVQGGSPDELAAGCRIGHRPGAVFQMHAGLHQEERGRIGDPGTVVPGPEVPGGIDGKDELGVIRFNGDERGFDGPGGQEKAQECGCEEESFHIDDLRLQFTHFFLNN